MGLFDRFVSSSYFFAPGPLSFEEPFYNWDIDEYVRYSPESITDSILRVPGTTILHPAAPTWNDWEAVWEQEGRQIIMDDCQFCEDENTWSQLLLTCDCDLCDLFRLWDMIQIKHPAVWLHSGDDCRVFTPASFLEEWEKRESH